MGTQGTGNFNAGNIKKVEIELDSKMLAAALAKNTDALTEVINALLANDAFIRKLAVLVRNEMLRTSRPTGNVLGKYAGGPNSR